MANKSEAIRLLERMTKGELIGIARAQALPFTGSRAALARRIGIHYHRDLDALVSNAGPMHRDAWNDVVEREFHGKRRRSFEEVREEIRRGLDGHAEQLIASLVLQNVSVADLRRDRDLAGRIADLLGTSRTRLLNFVAEEHGRRGIASLAPALVRYFQARLDDATELEPEDDSDDEPSAREPSAPEPLPRSRVSDGSAPYVPAKLTASITPPQDGYWLGARWRIVKKIGSGGMGSVYEVVNKRGSLRVAKVAHGDGTDTDALIREAELGLELAHENVCRFYELDDDPKHGVFAIMQHCGESLDQRFKRIPADPLDAMSLLSAAAVGIDYLHSKNVIHGDVSPANILVDAHGQVRITDFGIASEMRAVTKTTGLTHIGELRGRNAAYAADEVNAGQPPRRGSDQASLAKVLCALLLGTDQYMRERRYTFQRLGAAQAAIDIALSADIHRRHESCTKFMNALMGGA